MVSISKENIREGKPVQVNVNGTPVCVARVGDDFYAIADTCSHSDASLSEGEMNGFEIECWLHGASFDIRTGQALTPPAVAPVEVFSVKDNGETVEIG